MERNIFISWSGEKSQKIAIAFQRWIDKYFNFNIWLSCKEIVLGKAWDPQIQEALKKADVGVFFITKENVFAPWINFEAGGISKGDPEKNVCIVKIDINDIPKESPLFHYQSCMFNKEGIFNLLNKVLRNDSLPDDSFKILFENYWGELYKEYLKIIYSENPLIDENYIPVFKSIIPESMKNELKKADKININNFFEKEYEKIDENSIGKRLQFIIDRTVVFVYLDNNKCWGDYLYKLEYSNNEQCSIDNYKSYNIAIKILKEIFKYHKMMRDNNDECYIHIDPEDIKNKLLKIYNDLKMDPNLIKNKMLYCLLFDYLGLCCLKTACKKIAEGLQQNSFDILEISDRKKIKKINYIDSLAIIDSLKESIQWFDEVLKISSYENEIGFKQMSEYIWEGYALYNKARGEYLLYCFNFKNVNWETTMEQAITVRRESVVKYKDMPFAIFSNLFSEYLHARLEQYSYLNKKPSIGFEKEFNRWIELCYEDILNIKNKYEKIKSM